MPRSVTRTSQRARDQRRDEILEALAAAVERLYAAGESYTKLSVERLVRQAGISRTTFYFYFVDKGDLLYALTEKAVGALVETTRLWWDLPPGATRDDLRDALRRTYEQSIPSRGVMASIVEMSSYDPLVRERYRELVARSIAEATRHVEEGMRDGLVDSEVDGRRIAAWLCWGMEVGLREIARPDRGEDLDAWLDGLTGIVWSTLYRGVR